MIGLKRKDTEPAPARCDHVFGFTTQANVHIFKCSECGVEHRFTGDSKLDSFGQSSAVVSPL